MIDWQTGPAPKDGSKLLVIFKNGPPHVMCWMPGRRGLRSGWYQFTHYFASVAERVGVLANEDPVCWDRINLPGEE